jgi:hypothetical protein
MSRVVLGALSRSIRIDITRYTGLGGKPGLRRSPAQDRLHPIVAKFAASEIIG